MAGSIIQIKRTGVSGRQPNTTNASNSAYIDVGELALNFTDSILYSSDGNNVIEIGSNVTNQNVTGILTANTANVNYITAQEEFVLPVGNTDARPINPSIGSLRFNSELSALEGYDGTSWIQFGPSQFTFEGDLQTLSGTEDLEQGSGTFDLN